MPASKTLPENYVVKGSLDLSKNLRAAVILNGIALPLLALFGWAFIRAAFWMRPAEAGSAITLQLASLIDGLRVIGAVLAITVVMLVLHEAVHGLFFWLFTGTRPVFGMGPGYAYAAAPDWYLPRGQYLLVGLAPFVLLSLLGLLLLKLVPPAWFMAVIFFSAFNAAGAVGDMAVALWLLAQPPGCLSRDQGDAVTLYVPAGPK